MVLPAPLVAFLLIVLIGGLCYWARNQFALPEPAGKIADIVLVIVIILALVIYVLLPMLGGAAIRVG